MLKCGYVGKKYSSKSKQHELPDALSEEFLFKCLSVMNYKQFIVSIVLLDNFHYLRTTCLFYHFFKLEARILHGLENNSIFDISKL